MCISGYIIRMMRRRDGQLSLFPGRAPDSSAFLAESGAVFGMPPVPCRDWFVRGRFAAQQGPGRRGQPSGGDVVGVAAVWGSAQRSLQGMVTAAGTGPPRGAGERLFLAVPLRLTGGGI